MLCDMVKECNMQIILKRNKLRGRGQHSSESGHGPLESSCRNDNEPFALQKTGDLWLGNLQLANLRFSQLCS
jgi:hypothetical protein